MRGIITQQPCTRRSAGGNGVAREVGPGCVRASVRCVPRGRGAEACLPCHQSQLCALSTSQHSASAPLVLVQWLHMRTSRPTGRRRLADGGGACGCGGDLVRRPCEPEPEPAQAPGWGEPGWDPTSPAITAVAGPAAAAAASGGGGGATSASGRRLNPHTLEALWSDQR
jgi:hypothetical protein